MAKSPEDYAAAIEEFEQAARLAPGWPDPYYNLGLVQEKAGKFREAIVSLNRYLQLAPNAPDAAKIQEHIYKLEYKAERENILTIADIVDVLVSFGKEETWEIEKRGKHEQNATFVPCAVCGGFHICTFITRLDNDRIKVPRMIVHTKNGYRAVEEESLFYLTYICRRIYFYKERFFPARENSQVADGGTSGRDRATDKREGEVT
jgi:tetratricopeptide (TPR) repeat protein